MSTCSYLLFTNIKALIFSLFEGLPDFLSFVAYVLSYLLGLMIIFVCGYFFSTVATIIASPFYGLLADKVEALINGTHGDDMGVVDLLKDIPRILAREFKSSCSFTFSSNLSCDLYYSCNQCVLTYCLVLADSLDGSFAVH